MEMRDVKKRTRRLKTIKKIFKTGLGALTTQLINRERQGMSGKKEFNEGLQNIICRSENTSKSEPLTIKTLQRAFEIMKQALNKPPEDIPVIVGRQQLDDFEKMLG